MGFADLPRFYRFSPGRVEKASILGYDSAGIAYQNGKGAELFKTKRKIRDLRKIRTDIEVEGMVLLSQTDTEAVLQLFAKYVRLGQPVEEVIRITISALADLSRSASCTKTVRTPSSPYAKEARS